MYSGMSGMDALGGLATGIVIAKVIFYIIEISIGAALCFGALRWRKGLLTSVAVYWGMFIALTISLTITMNSYRPSPIPFVITIPLFMIMMPILTYKIYGVNRFMLGFLVASKLGFMVTTVMFKESGLGLLEAISWPLIAGAVIGMILAAWKSFAVSGLVLGCAFIGAAQIAPKVSELINTVMFGATWDVSYLIDPIDLLFSLFRIELTDIYTLGAMIVLMSIGIPKQLISISKQGYELSTSIIVYETDDKDKHGKIFPKRNNNDTDVRLFRDQ